MKVLFLDVDGVLNSNRHLPDCIGRGGVGMATAHISQLARVLLETGAQVVVSSTWRLGGIGPGSRFHRELSFHGDAGEFVLSRVIDRTVDGWTEFKKTSIRGAEIQHWLDAHPEVESSVILDDDSDMGPVMHRLVQTSADEGLTAELADSAIEMLGRAA